MRKSISIILSAALILGPNTAWAAAGKSVPGKGTPRRTPVSPSALKLPILPTGLPSAARLDIPPAGLDAKLPTVPAPAQPPRKAALSAFVRLFSFKAKAAAPAAVATGEVVPQSEPGFLESVESAARLFDGSAPRPAAPGDELVAARVNAFLRAEALERAEAASREEQDAALSLTAERPEVKIIREAIAGSSAKTVYAYFTTGGELLSASVHDNGERGIAVEFEVLPSGALAAATADSTEKPSELNAQALKVMQSGGFETAVAAAARYNASLGRPGAAGFFARTKPKLSLRQKGVEWVKDRFDLSDFTKSEKAYIKGQALFWLAISIYMASLPLLVSAITGDTAMTGVLRFAHYATLGLVSLVAGYNVKESPMKGILVHAARGRAVLFGSMGATVAVVLVMAPSFLPWLFPFLIGIAAINSILVAHNHLVDMDTGGAQKIFDTDRKIERAGYAFDTIMYAMMLVMPALIGLPMDLIDSYLGSGVGAALGLASFGFLMTKIASIYKKEVVILGERALGTVGEVAAGFKRGMAKAWARLMDGSPMTRLGRKIAIAWALLATVAAAAIPFGAPLFVAPVLALGGVLLGAVVALQGETFKVIVGNRAIAARWSLSTLEMFIEDALFAVVMPSFVIDVLFGGVKAGGFSPQGFANGLMMGAATLGGILASNMLLKKAVALEESMGRYRLLKWLTVAASLAFIPTIGLWAYPVLAPSLSLWAKAALLGGSGLGLMAALKLKAPRLVTLGLGFLAIASLGSLAHPALFVALPAVMLMKLMLQPLRSRMRALLQTTIKNDPVANKHRDDIFGLMTTVEVIAAALGGLAFAFLFTHSGPDSAVTTVLGPLAPMKAVTLALLALGAASLFSLKLLKPELMKPVEKTYPAFVGDATKALLDRVDELLEGARAERAERERLYPKAATAAEAAAREVVVARARAQRAEALRAKVYGLRSALPAVPEAEQAQKLLEEFSAQLSQGKIEEALKTISELRSELSANHQEMLDLAALFDRREAALPGGNPAQVVLGPVSARRPGSVLVLSVNWLIQEVQADGRTKVLVKKALTFDDQGRATLETYKKPRPARSFANFYKQGRDDGVPFERSLIVEGF